MKEKIYIINKKGLKLAAVVEVPDKKKKWPFVILLHGFKGYKEEATYTELAKELLKVGISSIRFDASGFGESEGTLKDDYRFSNYVGDTECVYEYLKQQDYVDKSRIGVMGQSMGGMQAIVFVANHPEIKAVVSVSAPDKMATRDKYGKLLKEWKDKGFIESTSSGYGKIRIPYGFIKDARKWNMRKYVIGIRVPVFIILGLDDAVVLPEQTRDIYRVANKPKKLWQVRGMDHMYKNNPEILSKVNKKIVAFFKKNL